MRLDWLWSDKPVAREPEPPTWRPAPVTGSDRDGLIELARDAAVRDPEVRRRVLAALLAEIEAGR
jgi:hypothetical protein